METFKRQGILPVLLLLILVGGLIVYKSGPAFSKVQEAGDTGSLHIDHTVVVSARPSSLPDVLMRSARYLSIVAPALLFGILIAGAVQSFVSPQWITKALSRNRPGAQLAAGVAGAPLMLCSCCVAPVFSAIYARSHRLGPSLAVALAAPSLNPAALVLTFMLFQTRVATARLLMALAVVFLIAPLVGRLTAARYPQVELSAGPFDVAPGGGAAGFLRACWHVARHTVPVILVGIVASTWLADRLPMGMFTSGTGAWAAIVIVSVLAVPLALPTFFEIPLAMMLVANGAPAGVAAGVLFAGPAVNLSSLITIARSTNWRIATLLGSAVAAIACLGGLLT